MHRLVTFLGIPRVSAGGARGGVEGYEQTTYRLLDANGNPTGGRVATPWIAVALADFFRPDEVVVVATAEAWAGRPDGANRANGEALEHELRRRGLRVEYRPIPTGLSHDELWRQFIVLKDSLRGELDELTLDITHGLRSQPFFAAAAMAFVTMVDENRPPLRIVYGGHDLIRTLRLDYAPIVDLSLFGEVLDWTHDIALFLQTGRVAALADRTKKLGRVLRKSWAQAGRQGDPPQLKELAQTIEAFARDLQTIRTGALLLGGIEGNKRQPSSARRLLDVASAARVEVERHMPPLADVLDRISEMARSLLFDGDALVGEKARGVLAALADLYLSMGRYVEAITLLREARITAYAPPAATCPGLPEFDDGEREFVDRRLWHRQERDRARTIAEIRNDIDHAGFRRKPKKGIDLIRHIESQRTDFGNLAFDPERYKQRVLVNISNHGWNDWSEEQKAAALRLVGRVEDVPFPQVDPEWTLARIQSEAEKLADALPAETTHALVQGEFTLTMALVKRLQQRGIRCLAATTARRVEKTDDGRELREFRFVRFRDYPPLV